MGKVSNIEWTDSTGGPHLVCSEVSPGCLNCYAKTMMVRRHAQIVRKAYKAAGFEDWETMPVWGNKAPRVVTKGFWKEVLKEDHANAAAGRRRYWFPSLIDWLDDCPAGMITQDGKRIDPIENLARFLSIVHRCTNTTFLLLTKRPENWRDMITRAAGKLKIGEPAEQWLQAWLGGDFPGNVWVGVSAEDEPRAKKRLPELEKIPAAVRFVSYEPALGPVDWSWWLTYVNWMIIGGESGPGRRPFEIDWARQTADQCAEAGVAVFVKQDGGPKPGLQGRIPDDLWKLKQFPESTE